MAVCASTATVCCTLNKAPELTCKAFVHISRAGIVQALAADRRRRLEGILAEVDSQAVGVDGWERKEPEEEARRAAAKPQLNGSERRRLAALLEMGDGESDRNRRFC